VIVLEDFLSTRGKTMLRHELRIRTASTALFIAALAGCSLNTDVSGPGGLVKYSGDEQSAAINTELPTPLAVVVVNQFGERIMNATVNWSIVSGGGTLSSAVTTSDDSGLASVTYTTGPTPGVVTIRAQVHGVPPLTFHENVT
jgi:hypothetical protein